MKNLALISIFSLLLLSYGQDIEDIKKLDTVYVKFNLQIKPKKVRRIIVLYH
jgi:hypothetical protein